MVLEFANRSIHVSGSGLSELFEYLLSGRVKVIREGRHDQCTVEEITFLRNNDEPSLFVPHRPSPSSAQINEVTLAVNRYTARLL